MIRNIMEPVGIPMYVIIFSSKSGLKIPRLPTPNIAITASIITKSSGPVTSKAT